MGRLAYIKGKRLPNALRFSLIHVLKKLSPNPPDNHMYVHVGLPYGVNTLWILAAMSNEPAGTAAALEL